MKRALLLGAALVFFLTGNAQIYYLLVGTYTTGSGKGIYVYRFDASTGKATPVGETDVDNPSYLTPTGDGRHVYAVDENPSGKPGAVSAFSFDPSSGRLHFLNQQPSGGDGPCYVSVDSSDKWVFVANYNGGSLEALPVQDDGSLGTPAQVIPHEGKGTNPRRQEKPHVHSVILTPNQQLLLSPDLGLDRVYVYRFSPGDVEPLTPSRPPFLKTDPGSGPRHIAFSPDHRFMYLIEEMAGKVVAYKEHEGEFTPLQTVPSIVTDTSLDKGSADIHLSPDGKFLYASNRGKTNNLTIFSINHSSGKLRLVGYAGCGGVTPRNFTIDPTGHFLLVANQKSDNVVIFSRNPETGMIKPTGDQISLGNPVCLRWIPAR